MPYRSVRVGATYPAAATWAPATRAVAAAGAAEVALAVPVRAMGTAATMARHAVAARPDVNLFIDSTPSSAFVLVMTTERAAALRRWSRNRSRSPGIGPVVRSRCCLALALRVPGQHEVGRDRPHHRLALLIGHLGERLDDPPVGFALRPAGFKHRAADLQRVTRADRAGPADLVHARRPEA